MGIWLDSWARVMLVLGRPAGESGLASEAGRMTESAAGTDVSGALAGADAGSAGTCTIGGTGVTGASRLHAAGKSAAMLRVTIVMACCS
jgi:hypothetical protein